MKSKRMDRYIIVFVWSRTTISHCKSADNEGKICGFLKLNERERAYCLIIFCLVLFLGMTLGFDGHSRLVLKVCEVQL